MDVLELIKQQVESNPVVIYMKGTPEMPRCGFSQRAHPSMVSTRFWTVASTDFSSAPGRSATTVNRSGWADGCTSNWPIRRNNV